MNKKKKQSVRRAHIGLGRTEIVIADLRFLEKKYSNYVLAQIQLQWEQCGLHTLTPMDDFEHVVKWDGKIRRVKWEQESHVATCTCKWPSSSQTISVSTRIACRTRVEAR